MSCKADVNGTLGTKIFPMHINICRYTLLLVCLYFEFSSAASNYIATNQFLKDSEALVSSNANFKVGFFSPIKSTNRYLGIWFNDKQDSDMLEVVWVANRESPVKDSFGLLQLSTDGNLQVLDGKNKTLWSSNTSHLANISEAQILDTGNLVLLSNATGAILWQSFEHPTDSFMPPVKFVFNTSESINENPILRSWKSISDPSNGRFSDGFLPRKLPEYAIFDSGKPYWRSGPWNGYLFLGIPNFHSEVSTGFSIVIDQDGILELSYKTSTPSILERIILTYDGQYLYKIWDDNSKKWEIQWQSVYSECDVYSRCGPFGICNSKKSPICSCLQGFEPKNIDEWNKGNWTSGCVRRKPLQCGIPAGKADKFLHLKQVKVPDYAQWISSSPDTCESKCLANCSCLAYSYYSGIGCMLWNGSLVDIHQFNTNGADLYVRLAYSELGKSNKWKVITAVIVIIGIVLLVALMYYPWKWMSRQYGKKESTWSHEFKDLPLFNFAKLAAATDNFSGNMKLGQGGFGTVYKGELEDGQHIAVKRLSRDSGQGMQELMNEVAVISKLQHKNLVRLLGCCVERDEKLLVYEYMPYKSLDALLFDPDQRKSLDWRRRLNIIQGICRGLLYLHRDSRLRIIHRDLKASNVLLDEELNPKISDFGMARIFASKQDQANTSRVVGTYGYMSPEYAMKGQFSEKSDVFSFGVLLLEIVSGKRNSSFLEYDSLCLLSYAWKLWNEDNMLSLIDPQIYEPCFDVEMLKCIQLGLLCVQEFPEDRPSVSTLISMLDGTDITDLPNPKQPGFTIRKACSSDGQEHSSVNHVSLTVLSAR